MVEVRERVIFSAYKDAHAYARDHFGAANAVVDGVTPPDGDQIPPLTNELSSYFFTLQSDVERDGFMDYHEYAKRLWVNVFGGNSDEEKSDEEFSFFENRMISGLHSIDMRPFVYPHVRENLETLIDVRADEVKGVVLWSTGDVAATGYQAGKIDKSGIIPSFIKGLVRKYPERAKELANKTAYMVDDDKFDRLSEFVGDKAEEEKTKIVIIEDSVKNFDKAKKTLREKFGNESSQFEVIPIWAAYSREGQNAQAQAEGSSGTWEDYIRQREELHAIDSFAQLLDPGFNDIFKDALVFVDFDGVIGDNIGMRIEQAKVIYSALVEKK